MNRHQATSNGRLALTACLAGTLAVVAACDDGGSGTASNERTGSRLADEPQSRLGRSAGMARDLADQIGQRDAAAGGLAAALGAGEAVRVGSVTFPVPDGWESAEPSNRMRDAELRVPTPAGECLITFSRAGGTVEANVERWAGQVIAPTGEPSEPVSERSDVGGTPVHLVHFEGTYLDGPPMGQTVRRDDWAVSGAIVETPQGLVFVKMSGPAQAMEIARQGWVRMIGGMQAR